MSAERTTSGELVADRYRLVRVLGRGGQATVWHAHDLETGLEVALKLLNPDRRANPAAMERLRREAELLRRLQHDHVARFVDLGLDLARPYVAMEYVRGVSLAEEMGQRAQRQAHFGLPEVYEIFAQLLGAVSHAHELGIVHRDLKPPNVMFVRTSLGVSTKLLDLGVAKLLDRDNHDETTQGRVLGSILYMPPEQAVGGAVDERADIFALGTMLFEVLTLRRPWTRLADGGLPLSYVGGLRLQGVNAPTEILQRMLAADRPAPSRWRAGLDPRLDAVLARALAVRAADRYQRAAELLEALGAALDPGPERTRLTVLSDWDANPAASRAAGAAGAPPPEGASLSLPEDELARARLLLGHTRSEVVQRTVTASLSTGGAGVLTGAQGEALSSPSPRRRWLVGLGLIIAPMSLAFAVFQQLRPAPAPVVPASPVEAAAPPVRVKVRAVSEPPEPSEPVTPTEVSPPATAPVSKARPARARPTRSERVDGPRFPELRAALDRLETEGSNLELFNRTAEAVLKAADARVSLPERRDRIKRLASASLRTGDRAQLSRAVSVLESSAD